MDLITNPLFAVVTFLGGIILGVVLGRRSLAKEWAERERLLREQVQPSAGCWVLSQIKEQQAFPPE